MTSATDIVMRAQDVLTVRRVFGEPIERDGVTVIPVARVLGGGGAGIGEDGSAPEGGAGGRGTGSGGGYGLKAVPAGVMVIRGGTVSWRPAVDVNRVALGGQLVAIVALVGAFLTIRRYLALRARRADAATAANPSGEAPQAVP